MQWLEDLDPTASREMKPDKLDEGEFRSVSDLVRREREKEARKVPYDSSKVLQIKRDLEVWLSNFDRINTKADYDKYESAFSAWRNKTFDESRALGIHLHDMAVEAVGPDKSERQVKIWRRKVIPLFEIFRGGLPDWDLWQANDYGVRERWKAKLEKLIADLPAVAKWLDNLRKTRKLVPMTSETITEQVSLEGFPAKIVGFIPETSHEERMGLVKSSLQMLRKKASKHMPLLLQRMPPIELRFDEDASFGALGHYGGDRLVIYPNNAWYSPEVTTKTFAHEAAHHLWATLLSEADKSFWRRSLQGDLGTLDLRVVQELLTKTGEDSIWGLMRRVKTSDPTLYVQLEAVLSDTSRFTPRGLRKLFGEMDEVAAIQQYLRRGGDPLTPAQGTPISGYATTNPEEAFCEAIGNLVGYGPRTVHPKVLGWLKTILPGAIKIAREQERRDTHKLGAVPLVDQKPGMCGPASLKAVLEHYGIVAEMAVLARLAGSDENTGTKAEGLSHAAQVYGLSTQIEDDSSFDRIAELLRQGVPPIVNWWAETEGHYSVVTDINDTEIALMDPDEGKTKWFTKEEFEPLWFDFSSEDKEHRSPYNKRIIVVFGPRADKGKEAVKKKPSFPHLTDKYDPTDENLWQTVLEVASGKRLKYQRGDREINAPNGTRGYRNMPHNPKGIAWAVKQYNGFGGNWRTASVKVASRYEWLPDYNLKQVPPAIRAAERFLAVLDKALPPLKGTTECLQSKHLGKVFAQLQGFQTQVKTYLGVVSRILAEAPAVEKALAEAATQAKQTGQPVRALPHAYLKWYESARAGVGLGMKLYDAWEKSLDFSLDEFGSEDSSPLREYRKAIEKLPHMDEIIILEDLVWTPQEMVQHINEALGVRTAAAKKYDHIDFKPPESVADAAAKGLEYRAKQGEDKAGLTPSEASKEGIGSGVQRASNLKNRTNVSPQVIGQMVAFFARHEKNKGIKAEFKGEPWRDKGYVSWLLWGGDPGKAWAEKVKRQMDAADEKEKGKTATSRIKILPEVEDFFKWYAQDEIKPNIRKLDKLLLLLKQAASDPHLREDAVLHAPQWFSKYQQAHVRMFSELEALRKQILQLNTAALKLRKNDWESVPELATQVERIQRAVIELHQKNPMKKLIWEDHNTALDEVFLDKEDGFSPLWDKVLTAYEKVNYPGEEDIYDPDAWPRSPLKYLRGILVKQMGWGGDPGKTAARAIPIDKKRIEQIAGAVATHISHKLQRFNGPLGKRHLGIGLTYKGVSVDGSPFDIEIIIASQPSPSIFYVPDAGIGKVRATGAAIILLFVNGSIPASQIARDAALGRKSLTAKQIYKALIHEITHAAEKFKGRGVGLDMGVDEARDNDAYYNDPEEVRAYMQEVVDQTEEFFKHVGKLTEKFGPGKGFEYLLQFSTTWKEVSPHWTEPNKRKVIQAVVKAYQDWETAQKRVATMIKTLRRMASGGVEVAPKGDPLLARLADQGLVRVASETSERTYYDITPSGLVVYARFQKLAGLKSELLRRVEEIQASRANYGDVSDPVSKEDQQRVVNLAKWFRANFHVDTAKTPRGTKDVKDAAQKWLRTLENYSSGTIFAGALAFDSGPWAWTLKDNVDALVKDFTDEGAASQGKKVEVREIDGSHAKFINRANMSEVTFRKYAAGIDRLLGTFKGWRRKALSGTPKIVFVGRSAMKPQGRYVQAKDEMWVRATPEVLKRSQGYASFDYILVHELGHRYERFNRVPDEVYRHGWHTSRYSYQDGESFAELFAIGHFGIKGNWDQTIVERFEAVMK